MKRYVSGLIVLILGCGGMSSARADATASAAAEFAAGDYEAAARDYESALAAKGPSAGLYYDLGLAQMKAGQNLSALSNMRRALLLNPRVAEARKARVELEMLLGIPPQRPDWRDWMASHLPLQPFLVAFAGVAWLGLFLFLLALFSRRKRRGLAVFSVLLVILGAAGSAACALSDPRFAARDLGVVISEEGAALRSAPADQSETLSKIPPGGLLRVLSRRGLWVYGESADGLKGWLSTSQVESLVPGAGA